MSEQVAQLLARCPLFGHLHADDLARIIRSSRTLALPAGQTVFRENQPCEGFYVVLSGAVRVYKIGPDGRQRILHIVRPPLSFAEAAMFAQGSYPAFAETIEDSRLVLIYRDAFLRVLREQPDVALRVFEALSLWMRRLLDQLENETFLNARAKLANYLLREARQRGASAPACRVDLGAPKKDIASHLGMAPETFSRALSDLEERRLIGISGRRIDLLDIEALECFLLGGNAGA